MANKSWSHIWNLMNFTRYLPHLLICQRLKVCTTKISSNGFKWHFKNSERYLNKSSNISKGVDYSPRTFLISTFSIACNLMGSFGPISCRAAIFDDFLEFFHDIHVYRVIANSWYNNATWSRKRSYQKSKFKLISPELCHKILHTKNNLFHPTRLLAIKKKILNHRFYIARQKWPRSWVWVEFNC